MHRYETLFVMHPELPEAQVRETVDRVKRLIEGMDGQIGETQDWGMRDLAYPIRKQPRGMYVLIQYTAQPGVVKELERTMKLADEILRFISVRIPRPTKASQKVKRPRAATAAPEVGQAAAPEQES